MASKEYRCKQCGAPISVSGAKRNGICKACAIKRRSELAAAKYAQLDKDHPIYCKWCGKQIHWNLHRKHQGVTVCSRSCQSYVMQSLRKETREHLEERLITYIKSQGRYVGMAELRKVFHIADHKVYSRGISCRDLNRRAGNFVPCSNKDRDTLVKEYQDLLVKYPGIRRKDAAKMLDVSVNYLSKLGIRSSDLRRLTNIPGKNYRTTDEIEDMIITWLKTQPCYVNALDICRALHIDFRSTIQNHGLDVVVLNAKAGHKRNSVSYYEDRAVFEFTSAGFKVDRQKTFPGLKLKKSLRYDIWLPEVNVLIEVNGQQHYVPDRYVGDMNHYADMQKSDSLKKAYAEQHGISLFILDGAPSKTFHRRLLALVKHVKGMPRVNGDMQTASNCEKLQGCGQLAAKPVLQEGSTTIPG